MAASNLSTRELTDRYVIPTYSRFNLELVRGAGAWVWDAAGKAYLDFGAGIAVTSIGHCHPRVVAAMREQLGVLVHTSNLYYTRPQALLAERLVQCVGAASSPEALDGGKVFLCNSGAEANEGLYKLARKFGNESMPPPPRHHAGEVVESLAYRHEIITMLGSFHGRTLAGISATGQDKVRKGFEPMVSGFVHVPFNDGPALVAAVEAPGTVAILIEPVQGESGIHVASAAFLRQARALCDQYGLLLMFDEIQCGLGRTGDWCGWKSILGTQEVLPDAVSWAKGIAGGFPLGAFWVSSRPVQLKSGATLPLCDLLGPGSHGTTFGGTPLVCAGALEVLSVIEEEGMLANARALGEYARAALQQLDSPFVSAVRGLGLMLAFELCADFAERVSVPANRPPSLYMVDQLHAAGLLVVPSGTHAVRWLPPLNVSRDEIDQAVRILGAVLGSLSK